MAVEKMSAFTDGGPISASTDKIVAIRSGNLNRLVTPAASFSAPFLDVQSSYNGSGDPTTTTGTVGGSSASLSVASAGTFATNQGICIIGAGTAGANHVTTIDNIVGTTITLHVAAVTGVTNAVVMHDDTSAINTALGDALTAGGGTVFLRNGYYRCSGALNGRTNSVITVPDNSLGYSTVGIVPTIALIGESRAAATVNSADTHNGYVGGVLLDFTNAPAGSGTAPSAISPQPFIAVTFPIVDSQWNAIEFVADELLILCPSNSTINGINLSNAMQARIGDNLTVAALLSSGSVVQPTHQTWGIRYPFDLNNVKLVCGSCQVFGFYYGLWTGEHLELRSPYLAACVYGLFVGLSAHPVFGNVQLETNNHHIGFEQTGTKGFCVMIRAEMESASSGWFAIVDEISDPGSYGIGVIEYAMFDAATASYLPARVNGATAIQIIDRHDLPPVQTVSVGGLATITITLPISFTNLRIRSTCRSTRTTTDSLLIRFNGDTASNYDWCVISGASGGVVFVTDGSGAVSSINIGNVSGADTTDAAMPSEYVTEINDYVGTTFHKRIHSHGSYVGAGTANATAGILIWSGSWHNTAAITSVTLFLSAALFSAGSTITVEAS